MNKPTVAFDHRRFGPLEVGEDEVLCFGGIPGFPQADRFALLRHDRESPFLWLVSLDDPDLAFVVTDPRQFFPDYEPTLSDSQLEALQREGEPPSAGVQRETGAELDWYAIATVRDGCATLNLAAPLVVDMRRRRGVQVILEGVEYSMREPLPELRAAAPTPAPAQIESKPQT